MKFTFDDLQKLNDLLSSAEDFVKKQDELFGEGFYDGLEKIAIQLKRFGYSGVDLHRHGVILGILLAQQKSKQ